MVLSLIFARRIRPIYRSVRKDVEIVDGRVGETFSEFAWCGRFGRRSRS